MGSVHSRKSAYSLRPRQEVGEVLLVCEAGEAEDASGIRGCGVASEHSGQATKHCVGVLLLDAFKARLGLGGFALQNHSFFAARVRVVKPRQPLCDLNPFESIFLILRRVGVRVVPTLLPELHPRVEP
jgi:hypothetical protein